MSTEFTLDDFAEQLRHLRSRMTTRPDMLSEVMDFFRDDRQRTLERVDRILAALRPEERREPGRVGPAERLRIEADSGIPGHELDWFFAGFGRLQERMRELAAMSFVSRLGEVLSLRRVVWLLPGLLAAFAFGWLARGLVG